MPLNEASAIARSNLTREQKHEALRALYGVPEPLSEPEADEIRARLFDEPDF